MTFSFSQRSLNNLVGVHPDLVKVANAALAASPYDFGIISGLRSCALQHDFYLHGKSQLDCPPQPGQLPGRHVTGHAIDFFVYIDGVGTWDEQYYPKVADAFKKAANDLRVQIQYGGDWPHFKDNDHIELDRVAYPDPDPLLIA